MYGSIDAFSSHSKSTGTSVENSKNGEFSKSGIFKIILDVFDKEREAVRTAKENEDKPKIIQSIFFDSCEINQPMSESLLDFIEKTNRREDLRTTASEFLMNFSLSGEIHSPGMSGDERIPVTFPNGNV